MQTFLCLYKYTKYMVGWQFYSYPTTIADVHTIIVTKSATNGAPEKP